MTGLLFDCLPSADWRGGVRCAQAQIGRGRQGTRHTRGMQEAAAHVSALLFLLLLAQAANSDPAARVTQESPSRDTGNQSVLEEVVVVAHKDERALRDIAANVTVLTGDGLARQLATSLPDLFRYTPGIAHESAGTRFGSESVNLRGIGGNRVAILLDGVPLSDQFSIGSFSNATRDFVDAGLVQRVEVLHGPASALYGSAAIGGVVAMRTPRPSDLLQDTRAAGRLAITAHSRDESEHATAIFAAGSPRTQILGGISLREGHETESAALPEALDTQDWQRRNAILNLSGSDPAGRDWLLSYKYQRADAQTSLRSMLGSGRFASTTALSGQDEYEMRMANLHYSLCAADCWFDQASIQAWYQESLVEQRTMDERAAATRPVLIERSFAFAQDIGGLELNFHRNAYTGKLAHRIGFGLEWTQHRTEEIRNGSELGLEDGLFSMSVLGEDLPVRDFPNSRTSVLAAYLEDSVTLGKWTVSGALRAERYALRPYADDVYLADNPSTATVRIDASDLSPKFSAIYHAAPSLDLYLQYAHGFRAPPFSDANIGLDIPLFGIRAVPNPDLKSETSHGFDLGLRWHGDAASVQLSLFHARYDDFIESKVRLGADPETGVILFQSQNLNEARIEGVELRAGLRIGGALEGLTLDGGAFLARGENRDNGEPLNSVGPAQAVVGIGWEKPSGAMAIRAIGRFVAGWTRRDETSGALFKPPGYGVVDLYLTRRIARHMTLRAGIRNLADREYWSWSETGGLGPDDPVLPTLARPGRNLSVNFTMQW